MTAHSIYELPIARYGTELLLERLTPYENSNRIPVTIVDALARELGSPPAMSGSPRAHADACLSERAGRSHQLRDAT